MNTIPLLVQHSKRHIVERGNQYRATSTYTTCVRASGVRVRWRIGRTHSWSSPDACKTRALASSQLIAAEARSSHSSTCHVWNGTPTRNPGGMHGFSTQMRRSNTVLKYTLQLRMNFLHSNYSHMLCHQLQSMTALTSPRLCFTVREFETNFSTVSSVSSEQRPRKPRKNIMLLAHNVSGMFLWKFLHNNTIVNIDEEFQNTNPVLSSVPR